MEAAAVSAPSASTGSRTMADMLGLAAAKYGPRPALRHKVEGRWVEVSYEQLGGIVSEIARGLIDLGIEPGDRISILSHTRPEWTYANFAIIAAGATAVTIYPTNSAQECRYVLEHSESRVVFVEDAEQLAKVREAESDLPVLEHVVVIAPSDETGDTVTLEEVRERGRAREGSEVEERVARLGPEDPFMIIYTSGTTGPPKGCVLTHGNYRSVSNMIEAEDVLREGDSVYLFLPLAHAFALLAQFVTVDLGGTLAYWEKDRQKIVPNLAEVRPSYFPSVPRIFEKIYTRATARASEAGGLKERIFWWSVGVGRKVRELERHGETPGFLLRGQYAFADRQVLSKVRDTTFGGNLRQAHTGAAPVAQEILEFFDACGVPVLEGYGMTETSTVATVNTLQSFRFGSVGKALSGQEVRIADDGEILLRGPNIFQGYYRDEEATREALEGGWLHTGDLGHLDEDGYLSVTGRKKDIIITAGGKNVTPANLEDDLKRNRWISQAVVVGDGRPYLVALIALDPEETPAFAAEHGLEAGSVPESDEMRTEVQKAVDEVNGRVGHVAQIKRFTILPRDLSLERGEITPTLKVKRQVVVETYSDDIDRLYAN